MSDEYEVDPMGREVNSEVASLVARNEYKWLKVHEFGSMDALVRALNRESEDGWEPVLEHISTDVGTTFLMKRVRSE